MSYSNIDNPFDYTLIPLAGGSYEVAIYEDGKYITRRYFTNISDAADWGSSYTWGLNRKEKGE